MLANSKGDIPSFAGTEELDMISGQDIVCVSVMDWDWPFWTSRQHLMTQFARCNRVLFVDPPLTFVSDYLGGRHDPRLARKRVSWALHGGLRSINENLVTWNPPPAIPFNRVRSHTLFDSLLAFNQRVFRASLRRTMDRLQFRRPLLWISFNIYCGDAVVGRLGEELSVYHCTDEISGFPGYSSFISQMEARLAAKCDVVLATSEVLRESKSVHNPHSYFVPNAADVGLFQRSTPSSQPEPEDLRRIPHPRAGFIGQVEYRFDGELLRWVAERMPEWSFVLIGPVQPGHRDVEALLSLPNVHALGLKERHLLPEYLAGLDVGLIPYKINQLTRGIYPLKLYEYLAAGKPVVATPIPALLQMADQVYVAANAPTFAKCIERAVVEDGPDKREERRRIARGQTWETRTAQISHLLEGILRERKRPALDPQSPGCSLPLRKKEEVGG